MEKIHQIGQEILDAFVRICEENGLRYYLFYGTLLGAVRHKGPIPWDDDVDVVMPREDMEAFRKLMLSRPADELYHVHCRENDPYIPLQYLRFCKKDTVYLTEAVASFNTQCRELWMDIWPLDYAPMNTGWEHDLHVGLVKLFKRASYNKALIVPRKSLCGRIFHIFLRPVSFEWLKDCTRRLMVEWNKREAKYYVCWNYNYSITKETFPIEWFGAGEKESYGGKLYCVPACWDKVLTQIYGDYMTLPPEEERRNHGPLEIKL